MHFGRIRTNNNIFGRFLRTTDMHTLFPSFIFYSSILPPPSNQCFPHQPNTINCACRKNTVISFLTNIRSTSMNILYFSVTLNNRVCVHWVHASQRFEHLAPAPVCDRLFFLSFCVWKTNFQLATQICALQRSMFMWNSQSYDQWYKNFIFLCRPTRNWHPHLPAS